MGFIDRLAQKLETFQETRRLEQRYALRKNRSGFSSDMVYIDGEYVPRSQKSRRPTLDRMSSSFRSTKSEDKDY